MQLFNRAPASPTAPVKPGVRALLADAQPDGSVRCNACAHRCLVRSGRTGICGVRVNTAGELWSLAYGAVAAAALDPIEKKPLFHVDPGSTAYSISTLGCPFHCVFCQNWEIAQGPRLGLVIDELLDRVVVDPGLNERGSLLLLAQGILANMDKDPVAS